MLPATDSLSTYRDKRDFSVTPEPAGRVRRGTAQRGFVIQRHQARQLHFDFRLELDGVLIFNLLYFPCNVFILFYFV